MASWTNATPRPGRTGAVPPDHLPRPSVTTPTTTPTGPLRPEESRRWFTLERPEVPPALDPWLESHWSVRWDLPAGRSYISEVLTHPSVHLTVESGAGARHGHTLPAVLVHGVVTRRFSIELTGSGRVFGVKFRPGGFAALTGRRVTNLTDRVVAADEALDEDTGPLLREVLAEPDGPARADVLDRFLLDVLHRVDGPDLRYERLLSVVAEMLADRHLTSVASVCDRCGTSPRTLQRLFRDYVGVGPKWVLQRFRLQDAQRLIDEGSAPDLAALAVELGWYDQAHFSRDFSETVGTPPAAYAGGGR
jgi:AraC-like DNA-binding protein